LKFPFSQNKKGRLRRYPNGKGIKISPIPKTKDQILRNFPKKKRPLRRRFENWVKNLHQKIEGREFPRKELSWNN